MHLHPDSNNGSDSNSVERNKSQQSIWAAIFFIQLSSAAWLKAAAPPSQARDLRKLKHTLSYLIQQWKWNPIWMLKWGHFNFRVTLHNYNDGGVSQRTYMHTDTREEEEEEEEEKWWKKRKQEMERRRQWE